MVKTRNTKGTQKGEQQKCIERKRCLIKHFGYLEFHCRDLIQLDHLIDSKIESEENIISPKSTLNRLDRFR